MSSFWFRYTPRLPTWHVVCSWPDGRSRVVAVGRSKGEAALRLRRHAARLLDADGRADLEVRSTPRGFAVCDGDAVHAALTIDLCEIEDCTACPAGAAATTR